MERHVCQNLVRVSAVAVWGRPATRAGRGSLGVIPGLAGIQAALCPLLCSCRASR